MRIIVLLSFTLFALPSDAATYFVRPGASGNGTTWANAWGNVSSISWSTLTAGSTVCVAGGTYAGSITTAKAGTAGNPITVKRATAADATCGSGTTGWNASYDALVTVEGISINNSYVTIDGGVWHGMLVNLIGASLSSKLTGISYDSSSNATDITIRNIEISGPCGTSGCSQGATADPRSIEMIGPWSGSAYPTKTNVLIQYIDAHGACNGLWSMNNTNIIVEHSRFADQLELTSPPNNCHENVVINEGTTGTFRYNEVVNWNVEGILSCDNGACSSSWDVYGNLWHDPLNGTGGNNRVFEPQSTATTFRVYNNTFVNVATVFSTANGGSYSGSSIAQNNIFYNASTGSIPTHDYNLSNTNLSEAHGQTATPPFVNSAAKTVAGYHLTGHTTAGTTLASPYNIDYDGNTRTAWDRGAFEYTTGGGTAPTITTTTLPGGTVGTAYSQTLAATGDAPITWSVTVGALPAGLSLTGNTISGTPTTAATSNFTVQAANATGTDTKALSIVIASAPSATPALTGIFTGTVAR